MPSDRFICRQCARDVAPALQAGAAHCPRCGTPISAESCRAPAQPSIMRGVGLTLGDLWSVVRSGKTKPPSRRVEKREVSEEERNTPQGKVTLRRTVIEEIEIRPEDPRP